MSTEQTLCLVDGSGYIFRAFYALPAMTRKSDGTPVNAVYGFTNMMFNLLQENQCSHMVVVFDAKRHNFRNNIYPAYKENRKETPPELVPQFALIRQATEALNIHWIEMEGFEADDLIATYARIATEAGWHARVISADKDLMQLMTPTVSVYDPMKRKELTPTDVEAKFGVRPDQVTDVQALMGDAVDNIPGATGVGPKTAAALINQYGDLINLFANVDTVTPEKRRELLIREKEAVLISKQLVDLNKNAPVDSDLEQFIVQKPNAEKLLTFLTENEFNSLAGRVRRELNQSGQPIPEITAPKPMPVVLPENTPVAEPAPTTVEYTCVQTENALHDWVAQIKQAGFVAIDTETTGLNPLRAKMVGISLAVAPGKACYIPLRHGGEESDAPLDLFSFQKDTRPPQIPVKKALELLRPVLTDPSILKIGHNIKYDMHIFARELGTDFHIAPIADTMLMSYTLNGTGHGHSMDDLAEIYLHHETIKYKDVCGSGRTQITFDAVPLEAATAYAAEDADITLRLYHYFAPQLRTEPLKTVYDNIDAPLVPIVFDMEEKGIMINESHLKKLDVDFSQQLADLTEQIYQVAEEEFNINSPAQLGMILFEKLGLPGGKRGTNGNYSTDMKVLEALAHEHELPRLILEYRTFAKLKSTYIDALLSQADAHKRVHTSFMLTGTNTGRLASNDPNLQNIPIRTAAGKEIRKAFISKPGYQLVCADYSQIELRLLADVANVVKLKESFVKNEDIHARTASEIFEMPLDEVDADTRRRAKAINFGIVYGISAFGLANQLNISRTDAKKYIDAYFAQYPEIKDYMTRTEEFAKQHGYVLTPMGRKCVIQGIQDKRTASFAMRAAINAPIQGGAADIIKIAMANVYHAIKDSGLDISLLLQVHDELVFEVKDTDVPAAREIIRKAMESAVTLSVPLIADVGVGLNWKEAH